MSKIKEAAGLAVAICVGIPMLFIYVVGVDLGIIPPFRF